MTAPREDSRRDRWIPWLFVGFFAVVLGANGTLVYFAAASWTGLETKEYYIKGLTYNRTLKDVERQRKLGWKSRLSLRKAGSNEQELIFQLVDDTGRGLSGASAEAAFVRPTHIGHDFTTPLADRGAGRYRAVVALPLPGQWDIHVTVRHRDGAYRVTRRIMVPQ
jgi:nitrogen fixation protein FixH